MVEFCTGHFMTQMVMQPIFNSCCHEFFAIFGTHSEWHAGHLKLQKIHLHIMHTAIQHGGLDGELTCKCFWRHVQNADHFIGVKFSVSITWKLKATFSGFPGKKLANDLQRPFPGVMAMIILWQSFQFTKFGVCVCVCPPCEIRKQTQLPRHWLNKSSFGMGQSLVYARCAFRDEFRQLATIYP